MNSTLLRFVFVFGSLLFLVPAAVADVPVPQNGVLKIDLHDFPENSVLYLDLHRGGHITVRLEWIVTKPDKEFAQLFGESLVEYGFSSTTGKDVAQDDGTFLRVIEGKSDNVFSLIRLMDSSQPFTLRKKARCYVDWDGTLLRFGMEDLALEPPDKNKSQPKPTIRRMVLKTEGVLLESASGKINEEKNMVVIDDLSEQSKISFVVDGLGEHW